MEEKRCTKCGEMKGVGEFYSRGCGKFRAACKECQRKRYRENPEETKARSREWRQNNTEKAKAKSRKYYQKNRENALIYGKKWRQENSKKSAAYSKKWRGENMENADALIKVWKAKNQIKIKAMRKRHCEELSNGYVNHRIRETPATSFNRGDIIPAEFTEEYTVLIKIKRALTALTKELSNAEGNHTLVRNPQAVS